MISSATTKPKIAVPSARAAPSSRFVWILPEASGWREMASVYPVALHQQNKTVVQSAQLQVNKAYNLYNLLGFIQCFAGVFCRFWKIFP